MELKAKWPSIFLRIYMKWEVAGINNSSLGHLCIRGTNEAHVKAIILRILFRKRKQQRDNVHQLPERGHLQTTFITICLFYSGFRPVGSLLKAQCFWDIPYVKVIILRILFCKRKQRRDNVNKLQKRGHPQSTFLAIVLIILGSGL